MPDKYAPEAWLDDLTLNKLSRDAELLFRRLYQVVEHDVYRFPLTPSPSDPRNLWARLYYLRESVRCTDVAHWLDELRLAGAIAVRDSERGWYLEVSPRLRFARRQAGEPRFGHRQADPTQTPAAVPSAQSTVHSGQEQAQLPLGPIGTVRRAQKPPTMLKTTDSDSVARTCTDSPESVRVVHHEGTKATKGSEQMESRNRERSLGEEERFARSVVTMTATKLGKRLARFLGKRQLEVECRQSGAQWMRVLAERPVDLETLLDQGERIEASEFANAIDRGLAKAKWLTKRLHEAAA